MAASVADRTGRKMMSWAFADHTCYEELEAGARGCGNRSWL